MLVRLSRVLIFMFLGTGGSIAMGQGVNPGTSPTSTSHILVPIASGDFDPTNWRTIVATPTVPLAVELDSTGPVWVQHLQTENGTPMIPDNSIAAIQEYLLIGGTTPWTGWHSRIATDGFAWNTAYLSSLFTMSANGSPVPVTVQVAGDNLDVTFPALLPGTIVMIRQKFHWDGETPFTGQIDVQQCPTPEPTALVLMAVTGAFALKRRQS